MDKIKYLATVQWLLSRDFLHNFANFLIYSLFPKYLDQRDWMTGNHFIIEEKKLPFDLKYASIDYLNLYTNEEAFFFDYVSDLGDSQDAVYNLAYAWHGDLFFDLEIDENSNSLLAIELSVTEKKKCLPRGKFIIFGGDTAYNVADEFNLKHRFIGPVNKAFVERFGSHYPETRPMMAIAGNHDYYNSLNGFNYLFRKAIGDNAKLEIMGHKAVQNASYFSVKCPFEWSIFALDNADAKCDYRQRLFFKESMEEATKLHSAENLIMMPANPLIVNGEYDNDIRKIYQMDLGINPDKPIKKRCDISGDTHHYERYQISKHHVNIVSGLGGATLHPTHDKRIRDKKTQFQAQVTYPDFNSSKKSTTSRLVSPMFMFKNGALKDIVYFISFFMGVCYVSINNLALKILDYFNANSFDYLRFEQIKFQIDDTNLLFFLFPISLAIFPFVLEMIRRKKNCLNPRQYSQINIFLFIIVNAIFISSYYFQESFLFMCLSALCFLFFPFGLVYLLIDEDWTHQTNFRIPAYLFTIIYSCIINAIPFLSSLLIFNLILKYNLIENYFFLYATVGLATATISSLIIPFLFGLYIVISSSLFNLFVTLSGPLTFQSQYSQFVRFKLDKDGLTGYVISVKKQVKFKDLMEKKTIDKPILEIIDIFKI